VRIEQNYPLERHNTFRIPVRTRWFIEYDSEDELCRLLSDEYFHECLSLHIGSGSNILFVNDYNGIIIHSRIRGISAVEDTPGSVLLHVGAAEPWDNVVEYAVAAGLYGLENLSGIPGETGAAAVQNIGAYGAEIKDAVETIEAFSLFSSEKRKFGAAECGYSYRHSIFKDPSLEPHIITGVNLRLQKKSSFNLDYGNLREMLHGSPPSLRSVRDAVIKTRRSKLPDISELGSAGSFFMNPIVDTDKFADLKRSYPDMPSYPFSAGEVKIPAGWLIEKCGFKGQRLGNVGVYEKQALVIVNHGGATGAEIASFAEMIQQAVADKFAIRLEPEVKIVL